MSLEAMVSKEEQMDDDLVVERIGTTTTPRSLNFSRARGLTNSLQPSTITLQLGSPLEVKNSSTSNAVICCTPPAGSNTSAERRKCSVSLARAPPGSSLVNTRPAEEREEGWNEAMGRSASRRRRSSVWERPCVSSATPEASATPTTATLVPKASNNARSVFPATSPVVPPVTTRRNCCFDGSIPTWASACSRSTTRPAVTTPYCRWLIPARGLELMNDAGCAYPSRPAVCKIHSIAWGVTRPSSSGPR
mmetsp:Transcript_7733/g.18660  ORF Transcript_7733/g.18660 Transcript_7733/m.18660 type:complete len:249 (+) Transcript_7733:506-1252(+)